MTTYKTLDDFDLKGKRVLVRADLDVPMDENFNITNDIRLRATLPTVNYLISQGAKTILLGHKGRPKGERVFNLSLKPIVKPLAKLLDKDVSYSKNCAGPLAENDISSMENGDVLVLENSRFEPGETINSEKLSKEFARLADIYINDAFATSHRTHASTFGIAKFMENKGIGRAFQEEVETLSKIMTSAQKPFLIIIGGAKISTKIGVLENLVPKADQMIIGGAMANTFLVAKNYPIGRSLYEPESVDIARGVLTTAGVTGCRLQLPHGVTVADELKEFIATRSVSIEDVKPTDMILDVGQRTLDIWQKIIDKAGTILWNGPVGAFETEPFDVGSSFIAHAVANSNAFTVIGGGDTLAAVQKSGADMTKFNYVSTAGGAMLEFLEGSELPALEALMDSSQDEENIKETG
jgi:phosphoglycerate kinase